MRRGLPAALDRIVLRALERDPDDRYATARELGREMSRFLANRRIPFGLPELAACMDRLFPDGRTAKRQLLEAAAQLEVDGPTVEVDPAEILVDRDLTRRRWLPGAIATLAALLLLAAWVRWRGGPAEARATPSEVAPHPLSGIAVSVSPVESTGDTLLLRVKMVPPGPTGR